VLFNSTIKYNIGYGDTTAGEAAIHEAADAADMHDRIQSFPDGKIRELIGPSH